jgi:hypothetical protein
MDGKWIIAGLVLVIILFFNFGKCKTSANCFFNQKCCEGKCVSINKPCLPLALRMNGFTDADMNTMYVWKNDMYVSHTNYCLYKDANKFWTFGTMTEDGLITPVMVQTVATERPQDGVYSLELDFGVFCHAYEVSEEIVSEFFRGIYVDDGRIFNEVPVWKNGYGKLMYRRKLEEKKLCLSDYQDEISVDFEPQYTGTNYYLPENSLGDYGLKCFSV